MCGVVAAVRGRCGFLPKKKTAKKEACVARVLVVGVDKPRMRCVRSNVCATGSSPHVSPFVGW